MSKFKYFSNSDMDRINENFAKNNFMIPVFDNLIEDYNFNNVLDIGCGNGLFTIYLKDKTKCHLTGIDGSIYGLNESKNRGFDDIYQVEDLCQGNYPLQDDSYDLVICKDLLEHLWDPMIVLREAYRVLKPGGLMLLLIPNHFPLFFRLEFLFNSKIDTQNYFPDSNEWNFPHIRFFTMKGINHMLSIAGFKVVKDYHSLFAYFLPILNRLYPFSQLGQYLAIKYPTQFSIAFVPLCIKL